MSFAAHITFCSMKYSETVVRNGYVSVAICVITDQGQCFQYLSTETFMPFRNGFHSLSKSSFSISVLICEKNNIINKRKILPILSVPCVIHNMSEHFNDLINTNK